MTTNIYQFSNRPLPNIQSNNITTNTSQFNLITLPGVSTLTNIPDNSYFATPGLLPLLNNSPTGVMTFTLATGSNTVLVANMDFRLRSYTGTSIQSYANSLQFLIQSTGSGTPTWTLTAPFSQTLSVPGGSMSVLYSGVATNNTLQLTVKPSVSTNPANISCDFNGRIQCGEAIIPMITFP